MGKLRICFAGTPAFAAAHLSVLLEADCDIVAIYTQPDRPSGRGKKLQPSAVKELATKNAIPLYQPSSLRSPEQQQIFSSLKPDLLIVVAYGLILPKEILEIPKYGCINVHASLLPRWRGAAPIERALLAGDKETGVTIMQMDEGLDTGDMLNTESVDIKASDTRVDLENKLIDAGKKALLHTLKNLRKTLENPVKQDDSAATYAAKLEKSESLINWNLPAAQIDRQVRAGVGRNPAFTFLDSQRLRILSTKVLPENHKFDPGTIISLAKDSFSVSCLDSSLQVQRVQLPGKKDMSVHDVRNSRPSCFEIGKHFSASETLQK
ncbi:MAG: methionyl-tRNA formyltransferase [Pseudohongiella sp.]|nr:methionyl-tRNA formyltransferase [Pseudohongiella sp.]